MNIFGKSNEVDHNEAAPIPERLMQSQRVAILTDDNVEDLEFFYPYYRLSEAGYAVDVLTPHGEELEGKHGYKLLRTQKLSTATPATYALLYLPGGKAPASLRKDDAVITFIKNFAATGKPIAAICHGAQLLVTADLVRGRTLSAWPEVAKEIEEAGGTFTNEALQIDGPFITARKPGDLPRHLDGVMQALQGKLGQRNAA